MSGVTVGRYAARVLDVAVRKPPPAQSGTRRSVVMPACGLMLLVPVVLVSLSFWPGHMNADTLTQIDQVRNGQYTNQHASLLLRLWAPFWDLGVGPGMVLTGQVIVFVAGLA